MAIETLSALQGGLDQIEMARNGDMKILTALPGGTYQMEWEHTYGSGVFNPDTDVLLAFIQGRAYIRPAKRKLLFGITLNGVCPADCKDCPFGKTVMHEQYADTPEGLRRFTLARPITATELQGALAIGITAALTRQILAIGESFSAGALLAGDPSYSHHLPQLMSVVSNLPNCDSSRWSTIAARTSSEVLTALEKGAAAANPHHNISTQVSLHSTDPVERVKHTGVSDLYSMNEISLASARIAKLTNRRVSLAFVLHAGSVIDPDVLNANFSPEYNIISLRPIYSAHTAQMPAEELVRLYTRLRSDGWDVVYMPPNHNSDQTNRPLELQNMRS